MAAAASKMQSKSWLMMADCLWSIIMLANNYGIDLAQAFLHTIDDLEEWLKSHTVAG